ncbi:MAG TPA: GAP family protein [Candidatus Limnocylindrales bacterium]|nr:GAP family protein [Candidatus Limnocylindrales bacterium]
MNIDIPTLSVVLISAAVDSINPCAIGVLILMVSVVLGGKGSVGKLLYLGGLYIGAIFITYLLAGLGLVYFLQSVPLFVAEYLALIVGFFVILAGLLEVKDFFWYGKGFSLQIPPYFAEKIHKYSQNVSTTGVIILGAFIAAVELPCTGAPYLAIITLLSLNFNFTAFMLLIIYNIIFVMPLVVILLLVAGGMKVDKIKKWKQNNKGYMRFAIGYMLIALGWLLILIANGTINFG